jgi:glutamine cyclotransferase
MSPRIFYLLLAIGLASCGSSNSDMGEQPISGGIPEAPFLSYTILNAFPHDTAAFTQGLEFYKGELLESTGLEGRSSLRRVDVTTGKPKTIKPLDAKLFGEGITVLGDTLYQLTWQNKKVLLYEPKSLALKGELPWSYEGWGITNDGRSLFISDGSDKLYVVSRGTLKLERVISVTDHLGPVNNLNELEYVDGVIFANRLDYPYIMRIDPANGQVTGKIDLKDVLAKYAKIDLSYIRNNVHGAVLNGIAWEPETKKMYVTGKLWPLVFEVRLQP